MARERKKGGGKRERPEVTFEEAAEVAALEAELFGGLKEAEPDALGKERGADEHFSAADLLDEVAEEGREGPAQAEGPERRARRAGQRAPVWEDDDDEGLEVDISAKPKLRKLRDTEEEAVVSGRAYETKLRKLHKKMNPRTSWAKLPTKTDADEGGDNDELAQLLSGAGGLLADRSTLLPAGTIEITRCKDANAAEPSKAVVQSVEFHPNGSLFMTAGMDKRLRFFQVDGVRNPKLQSVFLADLPIYQAAFAGGGASVVAGGRRPFFHLYDIEAARVERINLHDRSERSWERFAASPPTAGEPQLAFLGRDGEIPLVSLRSRQQEGVLKMAGRVTAATYSADGHELLTSGSDGTVYLWDLRTRRCAARLVDEGAVKGCSLAATGVGGGLYATGQDSGVVNLYRWPVPTSAGRGPQAPAPGKPLKALMNLTTEADSLAFSSDAQILAIGSRMKKDALRLVHLPSATVFSNWPTGRSPLGYVHSVAFSPRNGFLAVGNAKGRAILYRLHHYDSL